MDCPMILVYAGKCYKALSNSGDAISLLQHSTYKNIEDSFKSPIEPTTAKLNTANGSDLTALDMTALHLRMVEFKFTHNFVICDRLPDMEIIFGIDIQKTFSPLYAWDKEKNCYIERDGKLLTYTWNCEQKATIGTVKLSLKFPLWHNGVVSITITGPVVKEHMAYFITNDNSTKGETPTSTSLMVFTRLKGKHLSTYWYLIIPINT